MGNSTATDALNAGGARAENAVPTVAYWHVWTDDDGVTHQTRCELSAFRMQSMGGKAAPQWNDHIVTSRATVLIATPPVGWVGAWHGNPKPQWVVPLSGRWFIETTDGVRVEMGAGEISFAADQNVKPDAEGRRRTSLRHGRRLTRRDDDRPAR